MKYSWFHHFNCHTQESEELMARYRHRGFKAERSLNHDCLTWTVSVLLPEFKRLPRTPGAFRQRIWGGRNG
ncbi:hypothetical protein ACLE0V_000057 [Cronobacter sakazakii]